MNPLTGLPKTAHIDLGRSEMWDLYVKNHEVTNKHGFMYWLEGIFHYDKWNDILPQMISQGFTLDGVIETCEAELKDKEKLLRILKWYVGISVRREQEIINSQFGVEIASYIIKTLQKCKNWKQFDETMDKHSEFSNKLREKIMPRNPNRKWWIRTGGSKRKRRKSNDE